MIVHMVPVLNNKPTEENIGIFETAQLINVGTTGYLFII